MPEHEVPGIGMPDRQACAGRQTADASRQEAIRAMNFRDVIEEPDYR